ncbi:CU044_2847 family protein [Amycolatopsis sp. NPDC004378]
MTYLVELPVGGSAGRQTVGVEIDQVEEGLVKAARPGEIVARGARSLSEMVAKVRPVAEDFVTGFRGMVHAPDEIAVEFGLSLSTKADVIISSASTQANFKVKLTWKTSAEDEDGPQAGDPAS